MTAETLGGAVEHSRGVEGATLCEAFQSTVARLADAVAVRTWDGEFELTWREYSQRASRIAAGLAWLGVTRGETVALMMSNRPEFYLCDTAALHLGATPFSMYNTSAPEQIAHMLWNASNRVLMCERQFLERVLAAREGTSLEHVICVDGPAEGAVALEDLEAQAVAIDLEARWRAVEPEDVLTLIYTSGTTGPPKGVEITHASMLAMIRAWTSIMPATPEDRLLSYLPSAHIVDRMTAHYLGITHGIQVSCVADAGCLPAALREVRPTIWIAVPRVWEKLQAALETAIASDPDEQRRIATHDAIALGGRKVTAEQAAIAGDGKGPDAALLDDYARADELVLRALRARIGLDQAHYCCSGAAPASAGMLEFFGSIGLEVCEGWGMTELSGVASACPPGAAKHGTVGPPVPGLQVRLAPDGELLCRGATIMRGYRGAPEQTAETIDAEGWLHTGDIAHIDDDGSLRIVDRKKELIINAAGKNMSPANIEAALKSSSPLIGQCVCVGDRRPYNVALIVLDPDAAAAFAREYQLDCSIAVLAADARLQATVSEAVDRANTTLSRIEQIKRFAILPHDWLPDSDELTPTMKLKRKPIARKYAREIDALYETPPPSHARATTPR
ncbi:MAG TPA: AMP-binding protein [Solirubrobacteraceae bacterium]|jgi:long-chain acyl-CoA synthetase|nr:AMP-binding protein [Solirubrobacteraceae bacterium]